MILRTAAALLLLTVGGFVGYALAAVDYLRELDVDEVERRTRPLEWNVTGEALVTATSPIVGQIVRVVH